jgi:hypothetical protein
MIVGKILRLQHKDAVDVHFVLLRYDVNHDVGVVIAFPNASVDVLEPEEAAEVLNAVFGAAHEDYFEVSQSLQSDCVDEIVSEVLHSKVVAFVKYLLDCPRRFHRRFGALLPS